MSARRRFSRFARGGLPGLRADTGLRLTSMMDILTTLLFFLLKSFVAEPESVTPAPGVRLPVSESEEHPEASLVISVSALGVIVAGEKVAGLDEITSADPTASEALGAKLDALRTQQEEIAALRGATSHQVVTVQGDRSVEFGALRKVMSCLAAHGYESVALAVVERS